MYKVFISKRAAKYLSKRDQKSYRIIFGAISKLSLFKTIKNLDLKPLKGDYPNMWRLRVGSKRILFTVEEKKKEIKIWIIGERGDIYF